ncbi:uncharacterized protein LOC126885834 [Diabrotica virgifera virgifera]|uniref:SWIM-type domain-containing protein n=1 Tax=Diabrotica virgifera virgifera TaxID=50390 RepID=A0ABM5KED0_DIAVI|nr:uncharacterized protein LOC126885834 [Diabrotica virgifera virgifera]
MQCYICDVRVRARGFRRVENLDNLPPRFQEIALGRRMNNNLPEANFDIGIVIHINCYRYIIEKIGARNLERLSLEAREDIYMKREIFVGKGALCCSDQINDDSMLDHNIIENLRGNMRNVNLSPKEVSEWFQALRLTAIENTTNRFETDTGIQEDDFKALTNLSKNNFQDLYTYCDEVVVYDRTRVITKKDLVTFLMKLKYNLSDDLLKVLCSYSSRSNVSLTVTAVRTSLCQRFVRENLGLEAIGRQELIRTHVTDFANSLYNPNPDNPQAIIYIDGTYLKIPKSSNFRSLRQTYYLHKGYHLIKPVLIVGPDGYILDVQGPYFSDSRNNDAAILQHHLEDEEQDEVNNLRNWLQPNDIVIVDRGYRDSIHLLNYLGLECHMPPLLPRGQRQLSTENANKARLITKTIWIVEARNGHLKSIFKLFCGLIPVHHVPNIRMFLKIGCSLINKYFPPIQMQGATAELAETMQELAAYENVVKARVEVDLLDLKRIQDDAWIRDLTIGIYQVKLAPSYIQDKLPRENIEHFTFQALLEEQGLLRARVYSRFRQATKHQLWIAFQPLHLENDGDNILIDGYYCTCKTGARTVGSCAHVASVLWYLGYARHDANVSSTSEQEKKQFERLRDTDQDEAKAARNLMNSDLQKAKNEENLEVLTFDLEKTLPLPRIPTNIVFYKRQLWLYNCGIHSGKTGRGYCYVWAEGTAGKGPQEVASVLLKYLQEKLTPQITELILWSHSCGGQNRNIKIVMLLESVLELIPS